MMPKPPHRAEAAIFSPTGNTKHNQIRLMSASNPVAGDAGYRTSQQSIGNERYQDCDHN